MKKYISKPGMWFDAGTEAQLLWMIGDDDDGMALFLGTRNGHPDEEVCQIVEFDIVEAE